MVAAEKLPRPALESVRGRVVSEREERRAVMLKRLEHVNVAKLDRRLEAIDAILSETGSEAWRHALGARLVNRAKALTVAMAAAGHMYAPEQLHQVRIAAKKLRYALELAKDAGIRSATARVRAVKRAQDTLGRLHDLQVLQTHVVAVQAAPGDQSLPDGGLDIVSRSLEDECRHLHARYVAGMPKLADVVEATRKVVVPELAHPVRAIKMTLKARPAARRAPARQAGAAASRGTV